MKNRLANLLSITVLILTISAVALNSTSTSITEYQVNPDSHPELEKLTGYSIAIVSDLHLQDSDQAFTKWLKLIASINQANPDYVFLLGDYSQWDLFGENLQRFIHRFSRSLEEFASPVFLVLGNYETWTDRKAWQQGLVAQGHSVLENLVTVVSGSEKPLCVRGIGDHFTGHDRYLDFPDQC